MTPQLAALSETFESHAPAIPLPGQALARSSHSSPIPGPKKRATAAPWRKTTLIIEEYCGDSGYKGCLNSSEGLTPATWWNTSAGSLSSPAAIVIRNCLPKPQARSHGNEWKGARGVLFGLLMEPGLRTAARTDMSARRPGVALELRRPDSSATRTHLVNFSISARQGPDRSIEGRTHGRARDNARD